MTRHNHQFKRYVFGAENAPVFHRLIIEAGVVLTKMLICLRGSLAVSGGSASGTSVGENPGGLCQRMEIDALAKNGSYPGGKLKNLTPRGITRRRILDDGFLQPDQSLGSTGVTGGAATSLLNMPYQLRFSLPKLVRPIETALRLDNFNQIMLKITNGSKLNQFGAANDRTFDYSAVVWDIVEFREYVGDYQPPVVLYEDDTVVPINQANTRFNVDTQLSRSEAFLDILWIAETTSSALSDAIIDEVFAKTGSEQFFDMLEDHIKAEQQEYITDFATVPTGLYFTPFAKDLGNGLGLLQGAVPDLGATLSVAHPGTDQVTINARRVAQVPAGATA